MGSLVNVLDDGGVTRGGPAGLGSGRCAMRGSARQPVSGAHAARSGRPGAARISGLSAATP